ncbi:hypothetical protein BN946_scf185043.g102 [Trametes cinnabarina]|uniref:DUF4187 domain-containing protein n=1 Tax=Pycnoporus cinnabarinus TaxID=5643 RepID=A0A060SHR3_PYCCI|nr:hypothetical protein BN946_scf185043.g102 [Trametes cinnabarina]
MSDEEDDYLSDKFLVDASFSSGAATTTTSAPKTYAERRKEALKRSALKNEQNRSSLDDIDGDADADKAEARASPYSEEDLEEARQFLRLNPRDRLTLVLDYLRRKYAYCFWCGTQYDDHEDMEKNCPGPDEDAHD